MRGKRVVFGAVLAVVSAGCSLLAPRSDPTRFLVLASSRELREDGARTKHSTNDEAKQDAKREDEKATVKSKD